MIILKSFRFVLLTSICFYLVSCGNNNSSTTDESKKDTTATTTTETKSAPASTIVTTPQNILGIIHKVANYEKWKMAYEAHDSARTANGIHNYVIGRGVMDSNMVLVAMKVEDTSKAMAFAKNPALKKAMAKGGVM